MSYYLEKYSVLENATEEVAYISEETSSFLLYIEIFN